MSKLDELIREYCPDGVEYKELNELFTTRNGYTPSKSKPEFWTNGTVPWFRMEDIRENGTVLSDASQHVTQKAVKGNLFPANSIIVATSATIGVHALITVPSLANQRFTYLMIKKQYEKKFNMRFLYYYCYRLDEYCKANLNQGNFASVDMKKFAKFQFPIPPLPVQEEIVRILDSFTQLTAELKAELQAELQARKIQFEQYSMLLFEQLKNNNNICAISDICSVEKGKTPIQKAVPGEYPMVVTTTERKTNESYQFDANSVCIPLVSSRGHGVASLNHVYYQTGKFALGNILCAVTPKFPEKVYAKYLYYYFEETKDFTLVPLMKGGANVALRIDDIEKVKIPIPEIEIQKKIVSTLEKFDELCNESLPAEIEARQKQYEYYRDKLLTFKELS